LAEKRLNHKLPTESVKLNEVAYNQSGSLGQDVDVAMVQANIAETEKMYGQFVPVKDEDGLWRVGKDQLIQMESDPICSSGGCGQYKHGLEKLRGYDINYPVPNFGMDREIKDSLSNVPVAEKIVGDHLSDMTSPEFKEKWENPAKKVDYNFAPELDGNIRDSVKNLSDSEKKLNHRYSLSLV
jgi:hypothetical protein